MAGVRSRSAAQTSLPRDENADAITKPGFKGGLAGKVLQQPKSVDKPRKMLADITNAKNIQPFSVSKGENPKLIFGKSASSGTENLFSKDGGKAASALKASRAPLRNITNSRQQEVKEKQKLSMAPIQAGNRNAGPKDEQQNAVEDINEKIQRWAEEGVEKVHFTADEMDSLRQKIEDDEMEKRIAKILSYRTDFPRTWHLPPEPKNLKPVDVLELDHIDDRHFHSCPGTEDYEPIELDQSDCEDIIASNSMTDELLESSFPSWNVLSVREM